MMIRAVWTVVALRSGNRTTTLGRAATSWEAAETIAASWRATYKCPVHVVRIG